MAPARPTRDALPADTRVQSYQVHSRKGRPALVIRQAQGQARRVMAELLDAEPEEDSVVRECFPERGAIALLFQEAQRLR